MDITVLLASLWGPTIFALGIGIFTSRAQYTSMYRDIEKNAFAILVFGMTAMTMGIFHVLVHNIWNTFPEIIISLLGWGLLLKGVLFIVGPRLVDYVADMWVDLKMLSVAGVLMLVLGAYLSWLAYFV